MVGLSTFVPSAEAHPAFAECAEQIEASPSTRPGYRCVTMTVRSEWLPDEGKAMLEEYRAADPLNPWPVLELANVHFLRSEPETWPLFEEAARIAADQQHHAAETYALLGLALVQSDRRHNAQAAGTMAKATLAAARSSDPEPDLWVRSQRARLGWRAGIGLRQVYEDLQALVEDVFPDGPYQVRLVVAHTLAVLCRDTGRHGEAFRYNRLLATTAREHGDAYVAVMAEATSLNDLVYSADIEQQAWLREQDTDMASESRRVAGAARAAGNRYAEAIALIHLARYQPYELAMTTLDEANEAYEAYGQVMGPSTVLIHKALRTAHHDPRRALEFAEQARTNAIEFGEARTAADGALIDALIRWTRDSPPTRDGIDRTMHAIEAVRDLTADEDARAGFMLDWSFAYYTLAERLLDLGKLGDAHYVMERHRARSALETLDATGATASLAARSPAGAEQRRVLEELEELDPSKVSADQRAELGERRAALIERAQRISRDDATLSALHRVGVAGVDEVAAALAPGQAILSYALARPERTAGLDPRSFALLITRDGVEYAWMPTRDEVSDKVQLYLGLVANRDGSEAEAAALLYDLLLRPILADRDIEELILIPDAALHQLPFDALIADGEPLGATVRVWTTPSTTHWIHHRGQPARGSKIVAYADPILDSDLPKLPHGREEARAARRYAGAEVLIGKQATEQRFKAGHPSAGMIHLATHAIVDHMFPESSAIMLGAEGGEDGRMSTAELVHLDLKGVAVVMSSCRSATGRVVGGEGPLSLARGLMHAGSPTVIGALWPLRDDDASALFSDFYREVGRGHSLAEALHRAKATRRQAGAPIAAWAGVVLVGDGSIRPVPPPAPNRWLPLGALGVATGLLWLWLGRRAARRRKG